MLDIALDNKAHDLLVKDGDIMLIDNAERVAQQIKIQLWTWLGEWFLDITHGVPYLENILVKSPNMAIVRQILIAQIMNVQDVKSVTRLDLVFDKKNRTLEVDFDANTEYGLVTAKEILGYGR